MRLKSSYHGFQRSIHTRDPYSFATTGNPKLIKISAYVHVKALATYRFIVLMPVASSEKISLDASQVIKRIHVIDLPLEFQLLMVHRVHHLALLHVPSVLGIIPV
jgi:hypothetical protein